MTPLAPLTKQIFKSFAIVLPEGAAGRPPQSFPGDDSSVEQDPRWLFIPASDLALHAKTVRIVSAMLAAFIDDMSQGICHVWNDWKRGATFANVVVNAGVGILPPSGLVGPPNFTKAAILGYMKLDDRFELYRAYAEAIGGALEQAWAAWAAGYSHLSLPFPGSAVVGPVPPNPNVPMPLATGMSPGDALITPAPLASSMNALFGRRGNHASFLFQAFSMSIPQVFTEWKSSNLITNVMASGGAGMPAMGALGMGGVISGPDVLAQPEGWKSKLEEFKEKLQSIPKPKEIIASAVSSAIHNIKEDLLDKLPDLPGKPSLPGLPDIPTLPGIPSKPTIPKPGGGAGQGGGPGQGSGHTGPGQGDGAGHGGGAGQGSGHTAPGQGGGAGHGGGAGQGSGHTAPGQGGGAGHGGGAGQGSGHTAPGQGGGAGHGGGPGQGSGHTAPGQGGGAGHGSGAGQGSGHTGPGQGDGAGHGGGAGQGSGHTAPGQGGAGPGQGSEHTGPGQGAGPGQGPVVEAPGGGGSSSPATPGGSGDPAGGVPGHSPQPHDPLDFSKPAPSAAPPEPSSAPESGGWAPLHSAPEHGGAIGSGKPALTGPELDTSVLVGELGWSSNTSLPGARAAAASQPVTPSSGSAPAGKE